jgi:hypothetical protein
MEPKETVVDPTETVEKKSKARRYRREKTLNGLHKRIDEINGARHMLNVRRHELGKQVKILEELIKKCEEDENIKAISKNGEFEYYKSSDCNREANNRYYHKNIEARREYINNYNKRTRDKRRADNSVYRASGIQILKLSTVNEEIVAN